MHCLYPVAARLALREVFATLDRHAWRFNPRAGVLHVAGEPLPVPRHWLARDGKEARLVSAFQYAWRSLTACTVLDESDSAMPCKFDGFYWGTPQYRILVTAETWNGEAERDPPTLEFQIKDRGIGMILQLYPLPDDDAPRTDVLDLAPVLPNLLGSILRGELTALCTHDASPTMHEQSFIDEVCALCLPVILANLGITLLQDAIGVLASDHPDVLALVIRRLEGNSPLRDRVARLARQRDHARTQWPAHSRALAHFIPLMAAMQQPATPDAIRAWLREQGLSRKALRRLPYLPDDVPARITAHWCSNNGSNWRGPLAWLGHLCAMLYRHRDRPPLHPQVLALLADITTKAGWLGIPPPGRHGEAAAPFIARTNTRWAGVTGSHAANLTLSMINSLQMFDAQAAAALANTFLNELVAADHARLAGILRSLPDMADWISPQVTGEADQLKAADLGPRWEDLMQRQHLWHQQWVARTGHPLPYGDPLEKSVLPPVPAVCWPVPDETIEADGLVAVALRDSDALWAEGQAMAHCAGTYWPKCRDGLSLVYSVRNATDNTRVATLEFARYQPQQAWRLAQLRGYANEDLQDNDGEVKEEFRGLVGKVGAGLAYRQ